jgi:hypothetical protein
LPALVVEAENILHARPPGFKPDQGAAIGCRANAAQSFDSRCAVRFAAARVSE